MQSDMPLNPPGSAIFRDHLDPKVSSWIRPWDGAEKADVILLGAPLAKTSISPSSGATAPQAIREMFGAVSPYNFDRDIDLASVLTVRDAGDARMHVSDLTRSRAGIKDAVAAVLARSQGALTVVLGGDHSISAPSVEAFKKHTNGAVGLVQLDAHMDLRNADDAGESNGTPIRQLLDAGTLDGRNIAQVGIHAFSNARAYRDVAREAGITQISAREVAHTPAADIIARALVIAGANTDAIYVTVDMDVLDQAFAPGVTALVPGGMTSWQLFEMLFALGSDPRVRAIDIVEIDPVQDPRRATVRVAAHAMLNFLTGLASRRGAA
ncbi:MAG TPA: agmatinase family protein [Gemmatimonadaceae bacterium]|nr:agmatinase family protein [Gemmatimonadaceae bacterium]